MTTPAAETPTSTWQGITLTGTYCKPEPGGVKLAGSATFELTARVVNRTEKKIFPPGVFATSVLSTAPDGPSFQVMVPATDDPDNLPTGAKLRVTIALPSGQKEVFELDVPVATVGDLDLVDFVPTTAITAAASSQAKFATLLGRAGGVAQLGSDGLVPKSQLPADVGGLPDGQVGDVLQVTQSGQWAGGQLQVAMANVAGLPDALGAKVESTTFGTELAKKADKVHKHALGDLTTVPVVKVRLNGTDATPNSSGFVDLGTVSGGSGTTTVAGLTDATDTGKSLMTATSAGDALQKLGGAATGDVAKVKPTDLAVVDGDLELTLGDGTQLSAPNAAPQLVAGAGIAFDQDPATGDVTVSSTATGGGAASVDATTLGVTTTGDTTTTLLAALKTGDPLTLPAGTFTVSELDMPAGSSLTGAGMGQTIITGPLHMGSNAYLADLTIDCSASGKSTVAAGATVTGFRAERVRWKDGGGAGYMGNIYVDDTRFTDATFTACEFVSNTHNGNGVKLVDKGTAAKHIENVTFDHCLFEDNQRMSFEAIVRPDGTNAIVSGYRNITLNKCRCVSKAGESINVSWDSNMLTDGSGMAGGYSTMTDCDVVGAGFDVASDGTPLAGAGIELAGARDMTITGCRIILPADTGSTVKLLSMSQFNDGSGRDVAANATITDNVWQTDGPNPVVINGSGTVFRDNQVRVTADENAIVLAGAHDNHVVWNTIYGGKNDSGNVQVDNSNNNEITGNTITNARANTFGVSLFGSSSGNTVKSNEFRPMNGNTGEAIANWGPNAGTNSLTGNYVPTTTAVNG